MKKISTHLLLLLFLLSVAGSSAFAQKNLVGGDGLFVVIVNNKRGFIDRSGKIVIEPRWDGASDFSEDRALVATNEGAYKEGYIDTTGKEVIPLKFDHAADFSEGLAAVGFGTYGLHNGGEHKTGFIDKTGKLIIEPKYRDAYGFSEGLSVVTGEDGKYGYIDKTGKLVIPLKFEYAESFSESLALVYVNGKFGYIDTTGELVIKNDYTGALSFSEGLACVKVGGKSINPWPYSTTIGPLGGTYRYIDKTGKTVIKFDGTVKNAKSFSEGLAAVDIKKGGNNTQAGFIDHTGKFVISPKYSDVESFSDGLAEFLLGSKWTFLNKRGEIVFSTPFFMSHDFDRGLSWVQLGGEDVFKNFREAKYGYIDKTGKVIWKPTN